SGGGADGGPGVGASGSSAGRPGRGGTFSRRGGSDGWSGGDDGIGSLGSAGFGSAAPATKTRGSTSPSLVGAGGEWSSEGPSAGAPRSGRVLISGSASAGSGLMTC